MSKYRKVIQNQTTAKIVLRKDKPTKEGYQTALRVTHQRLPKYYSTKTPLSIDDFEKVANGKRLPANLAKIKEYFNEIESKANDLIKELGSDFNHEIFKERFAPTSEQEHSNTLIGLFKERIGELELEKRFSTKNNFQTTLNNLIEFDKKIDFEKLTKSKMQKFEAFLREKGVTDNSINIYISKINYVFNLAVDKGLVEANQKPFGKRKYESPRLKATEKHTALSKEQVNTLMAHQPASDQQEIAQDIFLLSLFCNGANLTDLLHLKYSNIDFDKKEIRFLRRKTKEKGGKPIFINLNDTAIEIIKKYQTSYQQSDNFLLNFLKPTNTEKENLKRVHALKIQCNCGLLKLASALNFPKITMYSARHTFASLAYQNTKDLYLIKTLLGHANIQQTTTYLHSLGALQASHETKNILNL